MEGCANEVPSPVEFEEVKDDSRNSTCGRVDPAEGFINVMTLEHGNVNVVVEEGGSQQQQQDYTRIRQEELERLRKEVETSQKTVSRQGLLIEKAKEKITEQQERILELEELEKLRCGDSGVDVEGSEDRLPPESEKKMEKLEKKLLQQQNLNRSIEEQINQKETLLMQQEADHNMTMAITNSEITTLRELLEQEKKRRVNAEMQLKKLKVSETEGGNLDKSKRSQHLLPSVTVTTALQQGIPLTTSQEEGYPQASSSDAGTQNSSDSSSEDEDVVIVDEIEKIRSGSNLRLSKTPNKQKPQQGNGLQEIHHTCMLCGLVCATNMDLIEHTQEEHHVQENQNEPSDDNQIEENTINVPVAALRRTTRLSRPRKSMRNYSTEQTSPSSSSQTMRQYPTPSRANNNNGMFICIFCEERFPIVSKLRVHMKQAHGIEDETFAIGCKDCGIVFSDRKKHVMHRRTVHATQYNGKRRWRSGRSQDSHGTTSSQGTTVNPGRVVIAKLEPGSSQQELSLQMTRGTNGKHGVDLQRVSTGYFCHCGRQFSSTKNIKMHIKQLTVNNNSRLRTRNYRRTGGGTLQSNIEVNANGMRMLTIEPQPAVTANNSRRKDGKAGRNDHRLVGPDPRSFRAKYMCSCGRVYFNRGSFQIHVRSKNNGKIFRCAWCSVSFDLHGNLKNHVRTFHKAYYGNGKFGCGNCAQTFETLAMLTRHRTMLCKNRKMQNGDENP